MSELGHVAFYVRDLQRSLRFYTQVVGWSCVAAFSEGGARCSVAAAATTNYC